MDEVEKVSRKNVKRKENFQLSKRASTFVIVTYFPIIYRNVRSWSYTDSNPCHSRTCLRTSKWLTYHVHSAEVERASGFAYYKVLREVLAPQSVAIKHIKTCIKKKKQKKREEKERKEVKETRLPLFTCTRDSPRKIVRELDRGERKRAPIFAPIRVRREYTFERFWKSSLSQRWVSFVRLVD